MKPKHLLQLIVLLLVSAAVLSFVETKRLSKLSCICNSKINCNTAEATNKQSFLFDALSKRLFIGLVK